MVRIGISVEGPTEERFIKSVLAHHLANMNVFVTPVHVGGNVSIDRLRGELRKLVHSFDYITTFYDFYGFKGKEPGETKQSLETKIGNLLDGKLQSRLIPYIQMYEFEGLLFSSPQAIADSLQNQELKLWAESVVLECGGNPEAINNSPQTAPSKRLIRSAQYRKTTHGPDIAKGAGIRLIRNKCQGFHLWLEAIESLAT